MTSPPADSNLLQELEHTRRRLSEAEETLRAIRYGEVDAVVVESEGGPQVYTLKSAAEPYRMIVEQMREGAATIAEDGTILYCNPAFERLIGSTLGSLVGGSLLKMIDPRTFRALTGDGGCIGCELGLTHSDGHRLELFVSAASLRVEDRTVHCIVATDLSRQGLRLRHEAIVAAASDAIYLLSPEMVVETWNLGAERLFGYQAGEMIGRLERDLYPEDQRGVLDDLVCRVHRDGVAAKADICRRRQDGTPVHVILSVSPLNSPTGDFAGYVAIAHDITQRSAAERTQRVLVSELNHRVRNMLAIIQSIANQTLRRTETPHDFVQAFSGRVQALARTHDLLSASDWQRIDLGALIREQLISGTNDESRYTCTGPKTQLDAQPALIVGLLLHELGTNSHKYGALTEPDGHISLNWSEDRSQAQPLLRVLWEERNGPLVMKPSRSGFGSTLIERSLRTIGGAAEIHFEPKGLHCEMVVPIEIGNSSGA